MHSNIETSKVHHRRRCRPLPLSRSVSCAGLVVMVLNPAMIGEFKKAYPNAKLIGVAAALPNMSDKSLRFDGCMSFYLVCV
jgi:hypothetical protein